MNCLTFECMDFFVRNNVPETIYPMPLSSTYMYMYQSPVRHASYRWNTFAY